MVQVKRSNGPVMSWDPGGQGVSHNFHGLLGTPLSNMDPAKVTARHIEFGGIEKHRLKLLTHTSSMFVGPDFDI